MSITVVCSEVYRVERVRVIAPAGSDPDDVSAFVAMTMRAAIENGRAGGRAVADGVMRSRALPAD